MKFALQGSRAFLWRPRRVASTSSSSSSSSPSFSISLTSSSSSSSRCQSKHRLRVCPPRTASFSTARLDDQQRQDSDDLLREPQRLRRDKISATLRAVKKSRQQQLHELQSRLEEANSASGAQAPRDLIVGAAPSKTDARTAKFVRELLDRRSTASASGATGKSASSRASAKKQQATADEAAMILKAQQQEIHEQLRAMREAEQSEEFEAFRQRAPRNRTTSLSQTVAKRRGATPSAQGGRSHNNRSENRNNNSNRATQKKNAITTTRSPRQTRSARDGTDDVAMPDTESSSGRVLQSIHALRRKHRRRSALPSRSMTKKSLLAIEKSLETLKAGTDDDTQASSQDVASIIWHWALRGDIEHAEKLARDSETRFGVPADAAVLRALAKGYIYAGDVEKAYTVVTGAGADVPRKY